MAEHAECVYSQILNYFACLFLFSWYDTGIIGPPDHLSYTHSRDIGYRNETRSAAA